MLYSNTVFTLPGGCTSCTTEKFSIHHYYKRIAMRRFCLSAIIATGSILLTGSCNSGKYAETAKMVEQLENTYDYDGKNVELHGNLEAELLVFDGLQDRSSIDMSLKTSRLSDGKGGYITGIRMNYGKDKPNSVFIAVPEGTNEFTMKDVAIYDKDGKKISGSDVTVKGTVRYPGKGAQAESASGGGVDVSEFKPGKTEDDHNYTIENVTIEQG